MNYSIDSKWNRETTFNNYFNEELNIAFNNLGYSVQIIKSKLHWANRELPDGIGIIDGIRRFIIEYKRFHTYKKHTIPSAACQEVCYIYDEYKDSIVPIKLHIIITETELLLISHDKYEFIYENFALLRNKYPDIKANRFYHEVPEAKELFKDVKQLADVIYDMKDLNILELISFIYNKFN